LDTVQLFAPVRRVSQKIRARCVDVGARMGLNRSNGLAQALAGLAVVTLLIFTQVNRDVILAWSSKLDVAPAARLLPIGENTGARTYYLQLLDVAVPALIYGLYCVIRLRRREKTRDGAATLAVLIGVIAIMVLMRQWPY